VVGKCRGVDKSRVREDLRGIYNKRGLYLSPFLSNYLSISMCCVSMAAKWSGNVEASIRVESERTFKKMKKVKELGESVALFYLTIYLYLCVHL